MSSQGSHVEKPLAAKKISQEYKDGWDRIFGKNKSKKKSKKKSKED